MENAPKLTPVVVASYNKQQESCDVSYNDTQMNLRSHYNYGTMLFFVLSTYTDIAVADYWSKYITDKKLKTIDHFVAAQEMSYGGLSAPHLLSVQSNTQANEVNIVLYRIDL